MLSNVSWGQYAVGMSILIIGYYCYIGLKYYSSEFRSFFGNLSTGSNRKATQASFVSTLNNDEEYEDLKAVTVDLSAAVFEKAGNSITKDELLEQLQERLSLYSGLRKPAYRVAINNYIIVHAKEICGVMFSEDELNSAWDTLLR